MRRAAIALLAPIGLAACTTPSGPVEVTRFVEASAQSRLGSGTIFVETAPGTTQDEALLLPYKAAVARELVALGYREVPRSQAGQIAQVQISRDLIGERGGRSPVSVGVGGSTGSYGSGVGLGIGINLGGGQKEELSTRLQVMIRDGMSGQSLWEGRAELATASRGTLADPARNAGVIADALFTEFPGNNGETIAVPVPK